jgi:hypothetical protein
MAPSQKQMNRGMRDRIAELLLCSYAYPGTKTLVLAYARIRCEEEEQVFSFCKRNGLIATKEFSGNLYTTEKGMGFLERYLEDGQIFGQELLQLPEHLKDVAAKLMKSPQFMKKGKSIIA